MKNAQIKTAIRRMQTAGITEKDDLQAYLDGFTGIWIPPERIGTMPRDELVVSELMDWNGTYATVNQASFILQNANALEEPLKRKDEKEVENIFYPENRDRGVWYPIPGDLEHLMLDGKNPVHFLEAIQTAGWKRKIPTDDEMSSLLGEFLEIANAKNDKVEEVVLKFVRKWGPLWSCANHPAIGCTGWIPQPYSYEMSTEYDEGKCVWVRSEPIILFQAMSKQVEAAIQIAGFIANNQPVPFELFLILDDLRATNIWVLKDGLEVTLMGKDDLSRQMQVRSLLSTINHYLSTSNSPGFAVTWASKRESSTTRYKLQMAVNTRWGFLPLVWLQLAQNITGSKGIYRCSGCDKWFVPTKRKPPEGRNHFCESCGKNKSHAKRLWAHKERAKTKRIVTGDNSSKIRSE
jgi:hypothetical protein